MPTMPLHLAVSSTCSLNTWTMWLIHGSPIAPACAGVNVFIWIPRIKTSLLDGLDKTLLKFGRIFFMGAVSKLVDKR